MIGRVSVLVLFTLLLPPASGQQRSAAPRAEFDAEAVAGEINAFYAEYWQAWDQRDLDRIADSLAPDFLAVTYVAPHGVVQLDKDEAVAGVRQFLDAVRGRETLWSRSMLSLVPRSSTEAVAVVRNDFSLLEAGGEIELTIEVLRKGVDDRWRLVRKWSEKHAL